MNKEVRRITYDDTKQVYYMTVATGEIVNESEAKRVFDQEEKNS